MYGRLFGDRIKAIDIGEWLICGGAQLDRFYCIYIFFFFYIFVISDGMQLCIHQEMEARPSKQLSYRTGQQSTYIVTTAIPSCQMHINISWERQWYSQN